MLGLVIGLVVGAAAGVAVGLLAQAERQARLMAEAHALATRLAETQDSAARLTEQLEQSGLALATARADAARLGAEVDQARRGAEERAGQAEADRQRLVGAFAEVSGEALQRNAEQFLTLADARLKEAQEAARGDLTQRQQAISQLLTPLQETLARYETGLRQLELDRRGAYDGLTEQVKALNISQERLQKETGSLVTALRAPQTRGRWGEMQLRRVVEMAGMVEHCDFEVQVSTESADGRLRPDLVVRLPGGAQVVVDAKVPLDAFLRAAESDDEDQRKVHLVAHARQLRTHVDQLAKKEYWNQFDPSPELVVAFVPGDPLLAAAFEQDPDLMEHAVSNRVLLTTPTTLIALLRTFALGWQQEQLAENARAVQRLGAQLYERLRVLGGHLSKLHRGLTTTVEAFNDTVGSLESRVLVTARRFPELGVVGPGAKELDEALPVMATPRLPQAAELTGAEGPDWAPDDRSSEDEGSQGRAALAALPELPGVAGLG
ncbi:MAG TPA: DNA recombination protein RmuC [Acidimicrobiales bacterium]|nr:DNA recombination protein RmuC [Acidimicrobiales bacterium]